ncbi:hypothetical protein [Pedobacter sp. Leaf176]|uniref:hypothetical protein n=1 Tax=Pedobacter sp. Leaf176 TaxID=1736286 RepID=UPI0007019668|nr:hypothetical protein [Pedobacter sp. Leaf176]KQR67596.1 hypothetical protein ASF92_18120 [Pedobacter sp. Leaf176]
MRNFTALIVIILSLSSCKKSIPEPDAIKFQVYATKIEHVNHNEPDILYWYLREGKSGAYYYVTSTKRLSDFSEYNFHKCTETPPDLKRAVRLDDIVVYLHHLTGIVAEDI